MTVSPAAGAVSHRAMVSVRRIAIAVGTVVALFAAVVAALALREQPGWWWRGDHALTIVVAIFVLFAAIPRLRRFLAFVIAASCALFAWGTLRWMAQWSTSGGRDLAEAVLDLSILLVLAAAIAGRAPLLRRVVAIVAATILAFVLVLLPLLAIMPFGRRWAPPEWQSTRHLQPLRGHLCRGVTLLDPEIHAFPYGFIGKLTTNFRGEHQPRVLVVGEFRYGQEWLPPEALDRMQVDDRDPALHPCERPGGHPVWPSGEETIAERLPF